MSRVFRAIDNQTARTVCLKIQAREKNEAAKSRASASETRPSEGEMAIHFVHPHVVRTLEYGTSTKGEHYLVMEYIDGVSIQLFANRDRPERLRRLSSLLRRPKDLRPFTPAALSTMTSIPATSSSTASRMSS